MENEDGLKKGYKITKKRKKNNMILRDDLYILDKKTQAGDSCQCQVTLNPACSIYQAHFPGEPITPGACLLQIAKELLGDILHHPLEIVYIKDVKFTSVIRPEETPNVTYCFSHIEEAGDNEVKAKIMVEHESHPLCSIAFTCKKC